MLPRIIRATYKAALLLIVLAFISGVLFYFLEESYGFYESLYWAAITMTTVGYGDYTPHTAGGMVVSVLLACFGFLLYGYLAAMMVSIVMESSLSGLFGMNKANYKGHFVICGWNSLSDVVLSELLTENRKMAIITEKQDDVIIIKRLGDAKTVFPIFGDPSKNDVLEQANIKEASVVILCMEEDSKNLITALHIKELAPTARIIVRTNSAELKKTMMIAGVTYVVTPDVMAGRLIASAAFEPEVANFIEDVTSATDVGGYDIRQYLITEKHAGTVQTLSKKIKDKTRTTLIGIARKKEVGGLAGITWNVYPNPEDSEKVNPGDMVLLLGNDEQFKKVEELLDSKQGR